MTSIPKTFLSIAIIAVLNLCVVAGPGDPDPSFGTNGTATENLSYATVNKVILQPDGKIIVVGKRRFSVAPGEPVKDYLMVRRYTATGALETIFNTALKQGTGFDAEVQPDGKVLILGHAPNTITSPFGTVITTTSPVVWRFNSTGVIDGAFGSNGTRFINAQSGTNLNIEVVNTQIVILYASRNPFLLGDYSYRVSRLSSTGNVDYTITLPFTYSQSSIVTMKVDAPSSDIVVLGSQQLRRYNIDGTVDSTFGTNGAAAVPYCQTTPGLPIGSKDLEIQPDGGILVLGVYNYQQTSVVNLTRQTSSGAADPAVCIGQVHYIGVGPELGLQTDGRFFFYSGVSASGIRFFPDGSAATSIINLLQDPQAIQPDQKIVTARTKTGTLTLTRQLLD